QHVAADVDNSSDVVGDAADIDVDQAAAATLSATAPAAIEDVVDDVRDVPGDAGDGIADVHIPDHVGDVFNRVGDVVDDAATIWAAAVENIDDVGQIATDVDDGVAHARVVDVDRIDRRVADVVGGFGVIDGDVAVLRTGTLEGCAYDFHCRGRGV